MTTIKRNIIANYLGQALTGFMALAFLPLYIEYLGMEAYGLIGFFVVMQGLLMLLDIGMTPTLNREMARFTAGAYSPQRIRELLRSLELICCGVAVVVMVGMWSVSRYLATDWLKTESLSIDTITHALIVMAFVVGMRLCEGIYRGSLYGLEQQVWYNTAYTLLTVLRYGGALAILEWVSASIEAFFIWQAVVSFLTIIVFALRVYHVLPLVNMRVRFSYESLKSVSQFAGGMMSIAVLTMILLQIDKVLLTRLLPLNEFGYYALAATAASIIYMIVIPVTQAAYPRMVKLSAPESSSDLAAVYHQITQLVVVLIAPAAMLIYFFSGGIIFMWSGNLDLVNNSAPLLSIIVIGSFFSSLSYLPYQIQIAHGWVSLLIKINAVIVFLFTYLIVIVVPHYGAVGAAWVWVAANIGYVVVSTQFMHHKLLPSEKWVWCFRDIMLPTAATVIVMLLAQQLQPDGYKSRLNWMVFLFVTGAFSVLASAMMASTIRARIKLCMV
jgi:O-antigen/teichoic acid export membrane protein|tara:strand:- start:411 stop:1904 length:1494 start_codon:yes stop_codon:yes gene_type:complete